MNRKIALVLAALLAAGAAHAEIVVIGNPAAAAMTKDQVADVFLGKSQSSTPVDLPESNAARAEFYKKTTDRDPVQVKSLWARLVFTGKAQAPKELPDAAAVKKAVAADPKAIGYIDKAAVDGSVKVLLTVN